MLRALVIDDETPARQEMKYLLEQTGRVQILGEAGNVRDAVMLIKTIPVDVLFLDIHMPGLTGMQLAKSLKTHPCPPAVVFVTAHSQYALEAFDANAVDYLVKPVDPERLEKAIERVERLNEATGGAEPQTMRIVVSKGNTKHILDVGDIGYFMAKDDYSYIHTEGGHYLSTASLNSFEQQLEDQRFFRTHRRYLVNLEWIASVESGVGGALMVTLKDSGQSQVPVSRRRVVEFRRVMGM